MNIYQLLKKDHSKVKSLLKEIKGKSKGEKRPTEDIFSEIEDELTMHIEGEEKVFYSALEQDEDAREMVLKSYEEHNLAKTILKDMGSLSKDDERWSAKLSVLREIVEHHIKEEEDEVFKHARKCFNKNQVQDMTNRFEEEKKKVPAGV